MEMVVNHKINVGDVEGEDYDCAALESSLSSLLGFLDPSSREPTSAMDVDKTRTVSDAFKDAKHEAGEQQPFQAAEVEAEVPAGEAGSPSESAQSRNKNSSGGASSASCGESANLGLVSCNVDKEGLGAAAQPPEPSSLVQHQHYETPLQLALSEEVVMVTKRASSSSCSSDGAGSSNAATVSPDLGLKVAGMCRATVRDMLKEVLLETLPLQNAVEVLFKMDSHGGWNDIRACATAILASSSTFGSGSISTAGMPTLPPIYRGSASLPSTPAKTKTSADSFTAGGNLPLAPPLLPPLTAPLMHLRDAVDASTRGPAISSEAPPSLPPPPPASGPALSSQLPLAGSTLAPLTPARSAPGAIPAPGPIYGPGGVSSPTRTEAAGGRVPAGSGESTPLASGPSSIASAPAAAAAAAPDGSGAGPSSPSPPLLTSLIQQHPHLVDCLQHHPQLLSSILNMAGGSGGPSTGGVTSAESLSAKAASAATSALDEVHAGGGAGGYGVVLAGLQHHPHLGSPLTSSGMRSPPSLSSPAAHGAGIWASRIPSRGSPISTGPYGSPQSHAGAQSGLEAFHALMGGGVSGGGQGVGMMLQGTDPSAAGYSCKTFEELSPAVRDKIQSVLDTCGPHIRAEHFDAGVRHWLLQLQMLFGEMCAVSALHAIETAANLEGVRRMKAFITTRLIDHYEQMVWAQDPQGYAMRKLTPDLIAVLEELVHGDKGLRWTHFDPKVLDTIREIRAPDAVRTRLSKLCAQELNGVQNVPAYLYTLLSKRGKTAKQAAAQKQMQELAIRLAAAQGVSMGMGFGGAPMGGGGALGGVGSGLGGLGGLATMGLAGHGGAPYGTGAGAPSPYGGLYGAVGAGTASTSSPYGGGAGGLGGLGGYASMFGL